MICIFWQRNYAWRNSRWIFSCYEYLSLVIPEASFEALTESKKRVHGCTAHGGRPLMFAACRNSQVCAKSVAVLWLTLSPSGASSDSGIWCVSYSGVPSRLLVRHSDVLNDVVREGTHKLTRSASLHVRACRSRGSPQRGLLELICTNLRSLQYSGEGYWAYSGTVCKEWALSALESSQLSKFAERRAANSFLLTLNHHHQP